MKRMKKGRRKTSDLLVEEDFLFQLFVFQFGGELAFAEPEKKGKGKH